MSISAFEGAAGCGKTYSVIEYVQEKIAHATLLPHQKLLALTFMHGARLRLDGHLKNIDVLASRYEAVTLDSFVWRICHRWRARAREIGIAIPAIGDFNAHCSLAGRLLAEPDIRAWVATGYPFVLVDEAQDLHLSRLEILGELAKVCSVAIAFDDFQCLDVSNRPVAVIEWVAGRCVPTKLSVNRRTNVTDLITAAHQIRCGQAITVSSTSFKAEQEKRRREEAIAQATGLRVLKATSDAVPVRLMKRDLLFVTERLAAALDERRLAVLFRLHGICKAGGTGDAPAKLLSSFLRKADESTIGRVLVAITVLQAAHGPNDSAKALREAAEFYKVDLAAITTKVKQEFADKEKAQAARKATEKAKPNQSRTVATKKAKAA